MFMCRSTCFERLHAHHQEFTTALTGSGFYCWSMVVAALLVVVWPERLLISRVEQLCSHWKDFLLNLKLGRFSEICQENSSSLKT
jgi:hypothetical protein